MRQKRMENDVRQRLVLALKEKGLNDREVSRACKLNELYIDEAIRRGKGSYKNFEKIAAQIGLSWEWLRHETGEKWNSAKAPPLDRESVLAAIEAALFHFVGNAAGLGGIAAGILSIAEEPPDGMNGTDKLSRIRNEVLGALRLFEIQRGLKNKG